MSVVLCVPWDSDVNACIPVGLPPDLRAWGVIDNSIYMYGGGSVRTELISGSYNVDMYWTGLNVLPSNIGAIGYWARSDYEPSDLNGSTHEVTIFKSGTSKNKIILYNNFTKNGSNYDFYLSARMYDSAGVQMLPTLTSTTVFSGFTDWHYVELNWLWNDAGGITEVSLDGTVKTSTTNGNILSRDGGSDTPRLRIRANGEGSLEENVWMDDFIVFDQQWHVGNFTPPVVAQCCAGEPTIGGLITPGTFCFPNPMQRGMAG